MPQSDARWPVQMQTNSSEYHRPSNCPDAAIFTGSSSFQPDTPSQAKCPAAAINPTRRLARTAGGYHFELSTNNFTKETLSENVCRLFEATEAVETGPTVRTKTGNQCEVAYYEDRSREAVFMVWEKPDAGNGSGEPVFDFFGTFVSDNTQFLVQPPDSATGSHSLAQVQDVSPTETDFRLDPEFDQSMLEKATEILSDEQLRTKRQVTPASYIVEVFFVIDYGLYSFWYNQTTGESAARKASALSKIKQFYAFVLNTMNLRYESVTGSGYTISLRYAGIYIADNATGAPFVQDNLRTDKVNGRSAFVADTVLAAFTAWANTNLANKHKYDHAMMFSAYDMGALNGNTFEAGVAGLAYTPGVCGSQRYSIVEDHFNAIVGTVAAHELGHNLNASHDGNGNNCIPNDNYIMAAESSVNQKDAAVNLRLFRFSNCSIAYFTNYMTKLNTETNGNCLKNLTSNYNTSDLDPYLSDLAGQVYPPDKQCEMEVGPKSALYRAVYSSNFSSICTTMACSIPGSNQYSAKIAFDGTTCGSGKICQKGECVSMEKAPKFSDEMCPFGDTPYSLHGSTETCLQKMGTVDTSYHCYIDEDRKQCCATCEKHRLDNIKISGCTYGDRIPCSGLDLSTCYTYEKDQCCRSCPGRALTIPNCKYGDPANNCDVGSCSQYTAEDRTKNCCQTCAVTTTTTAPTTKPTTRATTPVIRKMAVTMVFAVNTSAVDFRNTTSPSYTNLRNDLTKELTSVYKKKMGDGVKSITIISMRSGSLIASYEVNYIDSQSSNMKFTEANIGLVSGDQINVLNQSASALSVQVGNTSVTKETLSEKLCPLFETSGGCGQGSHCENQAGKPVCVRDESSGGISEDVKIIIIVIVCSIGVLVIILLIIACVAHANRARKPGQRRRNHERHVSKMTDEFNGSQNYHVYDNPIMTQEPRRSRRSDARPYAIPAYEYPVAVSNGNVRHSRRT
ncbi:uncharacterized protein LOC127878647 [Dreissena polymorpha]|uniref:uncharacterized protein LOC127878647 n=1 Tax=Dreissena polymorpha TaxID=45954 RepID=UPI002264E1E9|nr:uncharacterized protein LOC127878647 [Dreissena polymorpha]